MSKWISVKDRLPEDRQEVLTYDEDGDVFLSEIVCGIWFYTYDNEKAAQTIELENMKQFQCGIISHWQPLPEPPEETE